MSFLKPLESRTELEEALDLAKIFEGVSNIFVIGIGGSNLAGKAIYDAMRREDLLEQKTKLIFIESPDSDEYKDLENFIKIELLAGQKFGIIASSKSGETRETIESFKNIYKTLEDSGVEITKSTLVITKEGSELFNIAKEKGIRIASWSGEIGGRFSAFTKVHLLPILLSGLNIEKFISGAKENLNKYGVEDTESNTALSLATSISEHYENGIEILDLFFFEDELETLGKWCRQLIAESIGKKNEEGNRVGLTPTVSIGPRDLHSMLELYLGGPKNRFTLFVASKNGKGVNNSAYDSTVKAYEEAGLPFVEYKFDVIDEKEIGEFMIFFMIMTVQLAKLLLVNPFDQPAVEEYKRGLTNND